MNHDLKVPNNFSITAACYDPSKPQTQMQLVHRISPQTTEFCAQLGITDINVRLQKAKEDQHLCGDYEGRMTRRVMTLEKTLVNITQTHLPCPLLIQMRSC